MMHFEGNALKGGWFVQRREGDNIISAESSKLNGPGPGTESIAVSAGSEQGRMANQLKIPKPNNAQEIQLKLAETDFTLGDITSAA